MPTPSIAIVASRFNERVTDRLLTTAIKTLKKRDVPPPWVVRVPGAFEIPWAVNRLAETGRFDAIIALGCVIEGATEQNRHLSRAAYHALNEVAIRTGVPVSVGILTPKTDSQALARTRGKLDRGKEAAEAAFEMARIRRDLQRTKAFRTSGRVRQANY